MAEHKNPLDLNNLTMDDIDFSRLSEISAEIEREEKEYKEKYGDDWWERYIADTNPYHGIDSIEEMVNEAIYKGRYLWDCICINCDPPTMCIEIENRYWEKMKRLFGPFYKRHVRHKPDDPKTNKALIKDALNTGKWKELPDELQKEYQKIKGD